MYCLGAIDSIRLNANIRPLWESKARKSKCFNRCKQNRSNSSEMHRCKFIGKMAKNYEIVEIVAKKSMFQKVKYVINLRSSLRMNNLY